MVIAWKVPKFGVLREVTPFLKSALIYYSLVHVILFDSPRNASLEEVFMQVLGPIDEEWWHLHLSDHKWHCSKLFSRRVNAFFTAQYSSTEEAKGFSRIETDPDLNTRDSDSISALATT